MGEMTEPVDSKDKIKQRAGTQGQGLWDLKNKVW